jgi:hypothetical protein
MATSTRHQTTSSRQLHSDFRLRGFSSGWVMIMLGQTFTSPRNTTRITLFLPRRKIVCRDQSFFLCRNFQNSATAVPSTREYCSVKSRWCLRSSCRRWCGVGSQPRKHDRSCDTLDDGPAEKWCFPRPPSEISASGWGTRQTAALPISEALIRPKSLNWRDFPLYFPL